MRISIYTHPDQIPSVSGDTSYLLPSFESCFDVNIHTEPDPEACSRADVVFIRFSKSSPSPPSFLRALGRHRAKLFVNPPASLLEFDSKRHLLLFPHLTVPTIITRSRSAILRFARQHGEIVLKPLRGHGGEGIVRIDATARTDEEVWARVQEHIAPIGTPVVQAYARQVGEWGDKRVNIVGYRVISVVRTLPAPDSFICHRSAGGREVAAELTDNDAAILREVIPFLRKNEIWWAGVDILGPYLGEINVSSPMMIRRADEAHATTRGKHEVIRMLQRYAEKRGL